MKTVEEKRFDKHFGVCSICGGSDGYLNVGRNHWFVCHEHKRKWFVGGNLFGSWRHEDEAKWERNERVLAEYADLELKSARPTALLASGPRRSLPGRGEPIIEEKLGWYCGRTSPWRKTIKLGCRRQTSETSTDLLSRSTGYPRRSRRIRWLNVHSRPTVDRVTCFNAVCRIPGN